jgi:Flp pilus assembly protein TadB
MKKEKWISRRSIIDGSSGTGISWKKTGEIYMNYDQDLYCHACRFSVKHFSWLVGDLDDFKKKSEKTVSKEFLDAIDFSGFELQAWETHILSYTSGLLLFLLMAILDLILFGVFTYERNTIIFAMAFTVIIPVAVMIYLSEYPKIHAKFMKIHTLGDIPEIQSYLVMSMKLVPNMERAIIFAAENSCRPLARDLKKLIWDIHIRVYSNVDEALIGFASQWGKNSEYFKRSLHLVKSSTSEPDEAQRIMTLNKSLDIVLEGTKTMMDAFAAKLKTPTYVLYSIFILIPLALVALIPAVSIVGVRIDTFTLILIYNIGLPLFTFFYSEYILLQRPATFSPPNISDKHPQLSNIRTIRKNVIIFATIAGLIIGFSGYILLYFGNPLNIISKEAMAGLVLPTFPIVWAITAMITIYSLGIYTPYKKIRDGIKQVENEFADAMFILGRRISEGRSAEEAFSHTSHTMKGSKIGEAFTDIAKNLSCMRTTLHGAIFHEEYGAFKDIYSDRVHTMMRLLTESVHKSHEAAGMAIIKLADHLKELQDVENNIRRSLYDVTSTMRSTAIIFAPFIAGVTLALSEVIQKILLNISRETSYLPDEYDIGGLMSQAGTGMTQSIPPDIFLLVVGIYIVLLVIILTRFAGGIEYGDDRPQFMYDLGQTLPMSIMVFTVTTIVSRIIFRSMV